jgi:hypothetical protein
MWCLNWRIYSFLFNTNVSIIAYSFLVILSRELVTSVGPPISDVSSPGCNIEDAGAAKSVVSLASPVPGPCSLPRDQ